MIGCAGLGVIDENIQIPVLVVIAYSAARSAGRDHIHDMPQLGVENHRDMRFRDARFLGDVYEFLVISLGCGSRRCGSGIRRQRPYTFAPLQHIPSAGRGRLHNFADAVRPGDRHLADLVGPAQAEMNAQHALRIETVAYRHFAQQLFAARLDVDTPAHGGRISRPLAQHEADPVAVGLGHIVVQPHRSCDIGDQKIHPAVPVEIGDGDATTVAYIIDAGGRAFGHEAAEFLVKKDVALVTGHRIAGHVRPFFSVAEIYAFLEHKVQQLVHIIFGAGGDETVGYIQILQTVVVGVEKLRAPTPAGVAAAGFGRHIRELKVAVVFPQHIAFVQIRLRHIGDINIQQAVVVVIGDFGVHALLGVHADSGVGHIVKRAVAQIPKHGVGAEVVRHIHILPAVVVQIAVAYRHSPAGVLYLSRRRHIGECAVAVIAKQIIRSAVPGGFPAIEQHLGVRQIIKILLGEITAYIKV